MKYDIIIVGGGIVGAAMGLALAKKTDLSVAILEATPQQEKKRVSAISPAVKNFFQSLDVWQGIVAKGVSPYHRMQVWDAGGNGKVHFDCCDKQLSELGFIIEDRHILSSLQTQFSRYKNLDYVAPINLQRLVIDGGATLAAADNVMYQAKCVIAADGAHSWVRDQLAIETKTWDYEQTAIVATVTTIKPHKRTAWQRFLPTGPLAFLPLADDYQSSIVWSVDVSESDEILALNDDEFRLKLADAFAATLGDIVAVSPRYSFPLHMRHAKKYVLSHAALIGDAAHTIHPLAGQGMNLGLLDAEYLSKVMITALQKGKDFYAYDVLRQYERVRKSENILMLTMVDGLKKLFGSQSKIISTVRNAGLQATNQLSIVKNFLMRQALGE